MASGDIKDHEFQVPVRLVKVTADMDTWAKSQVRFCGGSLQWVVCSK